jgi:hypothetical protein
VEAGLPGAQILTDRKSGLVGSPSAPIEFRRAELIWPPVLGPDY